VRGHKGALKIYSVAGQGTTFKVLFPVTSQVPIKERFLNADSSHTHVTGLILVVDDEEIVRKTAKAALERRGFEVVLAGNGAEALVLYRQQVPKFAVVLDLTMPGMSGEETLRRLKSIEPDVKVILSSGYNEVEIINRFLGKGLAAFIQKPYSAGALVQTVERAILDLDRKSTKNVDPQK
jgi:two-component system, cell cycle sensor histidine kinase and response regulator CckA